MAGERRRADAALDADAALGLNVVRTGAHADGDGQWQAMQPRPGQYDERVRLRLACHLLRQAMAGLEAKTQLHMLRACRP